VHPEHKVAIKALKEQSDNALQVDKKLAGEGEENASERKFSIKGGASIDCPKNLADSVWGGKEGPERHRLNLWHGK